LWLYEKALHELNLLHRCCCCCWLYCHRFVIKVALLEAAGWLAVVFLELYPHLLGGAGSMYETGWWKATAAVWEALVLLLFGAGGLLLWVALGVAALLGWRRVRRRQQHKKAVLTSRLGDIRDLDV
jgi:hypothetical protein